MTDIWDDPDIKIVSEYVKFENVGDHVAGKVTGVSIHKWDDGSACPKIMLVNDETNEETSFTASQYNLRAALSEQRPQVGDHISVTFTGEVQAKKGKAKKFDVTVVRAADSWAPAPAVADPLAGLTPEQIAAVAALQAQQAGMAVQQQPVAQPAPEPQKASYEQYAAQMGFTPQPTEQAPF